MNKKTIIILCVILFIIVIIGLFYFIKKKTPDENTIETNGTVSTSQNKINIKGYTIDINAKKKEESEESNESFFTTSFEITNSDNGKAYYDVDFNNLILKSESKDDGINYDVKAPEVVTINGKEFEYYIDEFGLCATLYYQIPDKQGLLEIEVNGRNVYSSRGEQLKMRAVVDKSVIESQELAKVLDFSINK